MKIKLSKLAQFKGGSAFPQDQQGRSAGAFPFMKVSDLSLDTGAWKTTRANNWLTYEQAKALKPTIVPPSSTIFAKIGEGLKNERCRITTRPTAIDNNMMAAIPTEFVNAKYLYFMLKTIGLSTYAVGSALPYLKQGTLNNIEVEVPSLDEQYAIAEVLGALDDKITANTKLANTADQFLAALFKHITDGTSTLRLGDVAIVNPESCKPVRGGILRYVDISSVGQGTFEFPEISSWDEAPSRARRSLKSGDTLWSTVRPNRRSHALNLSNDPLLVGSTGLAILRPREVGFAYLFEATKTPDFTAYLENVAEGSAYPAVRANRFAEAPIVWAPPRERDSFETMAAPLRKALHRLDSENVHLTSVRDALLPQLMAGNLKVKQAEEIIASAI